MEAKWKWNLDDAAEGIHAALGARVVILGLGAGSRFQLKAMATRRRKYLIITERNQVLGLVPDTAKTRLMVDVKFDLVRIGSLTKHGI
ncbi:hypothetical protein Trco_002425 [Trichoderma cornu-damae]|uniref:Uncharacterized protein n=1 Tax=Trichoderma cornu-damae TaxID=654480 RepID=A0A9P8TXT5_9HYPO|nr:hypothetical protein Trco_002425 [Trichoderma cornu-damae]